VDGCGCGAGAAALKEQRFGCWRELTSAYSAGAGYREVTEFDPKLNSQREWLNRKLKLLITDCGLGDAALYLSNKRATPLNVEPLFAVLTLQSNQRPYGTD
jgi:hypothetical protein